MDALAISASQLGVSPNIYTSRKAAKIRTERAWRPSPRKRGFGAVHGPNAASFAASTHAPRLDAFGNTRVSLDFSSALSDSPVRMANFSVL